MFLQELLLAHVWKKRKKQVFHVFGIWNQCNQKPPLWRWTSTTSRITRHCAKLVLTSCGPLPSFQFCAQILHETSWVHRHLRGFLGWLTALNAYILTRLGFCVFRLGNSLWFVKPNRLTQKMCRVMCEFSVSLSILAAMYAQTKTLQKIINKTLHSAHNTPETIEQETDLEISVPKMSHTQKHANLNKLAVKNVSLHAFRVWMHPATQKLSFGTIVEQHKNTKTANPWSTVSRKTTNSWSSYRESTWFHIDISTV